MKLTKRLECVANALGPVGVLADVGCDHAYLPIALVERGQAERAIGLDVAEGPLRTAKENVARCGLADRIELRLSDGMQALAAGEADALSICGMGGLLMLRLLEDRRDLLSGFSRIVLSPQSDFEAFLQGIDALGYHVGKEDFVCDRGKHYAVLVIEPGKQAGYRFGRQLLDEGHEEYIRYCRMRYGQLDAVARNLRQKGIALPEELLRQLTALEETSPFWRE